MITLKKYVFLLLGFTIIGLGVTLMAKVNHVGLEPWVAVNIGLLNWKFTYGFWNAFFQVIFIIITWFIEKRPPRLGTFLNMVYTSLVVDIFMYFDFVPIIERGIPSYLFYVFAVFVTCVGSSMAIASNLGPGGKTQFYVVISEKTQIKLSHSKYLMELLGLTLAFLAGGPIFIGTLIYIMFSGYFVGSFVPVFKKMLRKMKLNS